MCEPDQSCLTASAIQRDLSKAVSERVRASKEEADNARKGRTLQKLDDAPAGQGALLHLADLGRCHATTWTYLSSSYACTHAALGADLWSVKNMCQQA